MDTFNILRHRLPAVARPITSPRLHRQGRFIKESFPLHRPRIQYALYSQSSGATSEPVVSSPKSSIITSVNEHDVQATSEPATTTMQQAPETLTRAASATPSLSSGSHHRPRESHSGSQENDATESSAAPPPRLRLKYHVSRTHTNNLPIYKDSKAHGTLKLTLVRKITGDAHALKKDLIELLGVSPKDAAVVPPANYIKIKGVHDYRIQQHLLAQGF